MKLTIATVVFNAEKTIYRSSQAIKHEISNYENSSNIEYLVIDGNSKDRTLEIIKQTFIGVENLRIISEQDSGIYDAYNKAVNNASGSFIWFVNGDDIIRPGSLKIVMQKIDKHPQHDLLCFSLNRVNNGTGFFKLHLRDTKHPIKLFSPVCHTPAVIFNRKSIIKSKLFDASLSICADFKLIQSIYRVGRVKGFKDCVIDMHLGGVSSQYKTEYIKANEQIFIILSQPEGIVIKAFYCFKIIVKLIRNTTINPILRFIKSSAKL
jgi:glycosyltransferase involved in cell wall biosynthesis